MIEENPYDTEEERRIQEILLSALAIRDERARELYIKKESGDNHQRYVRVMAGLDEAINGERVQLRLVIKEGEEIGNYKIIEKIKGGGFATVYKAEHKISRTFAAIKVFDKLVGEDEKDIFWNKESKSLSRLDHDNIVKFYDLGFYEKDGKRLPYVVVELVKGKHLDEHCKAQEPSVREVLGLFRSLCGVIDYIHSKEKLIHLDLKPNNIFVTANRPHRIKLIDFGSSKLFRSEPRRLTRSDFINPLTRKFASPEQFDEDAESDRQSDIYSLGAVLYLLFTEKVPFGEGEIDREKIKREVTDRNLLPVPPSKRVLELKQKIKFGLPLKTLSGVLKGDLDFIIMKCLEKRRRNRYQTVSELKQDIDNFLRGKPLKTRQKPLGYKAGKTVTRLLGLEGGRSGWSKWKKPLRRVSVLGVLLTLSGFIGYGIYRRLTQGSDMFTPKSVKVQPMPLRVRQGDSVYPDQVFNALYIRCREENETCFSFMEIPGGTFEMGKRPDEKFGLNEKEEEEFNRQEKEQSFTPLHKVNIRRFYMGRFEVSNRQWNIVANMPKIRMTLEVAGEDSATPKTNISYSKAKEFCDRLSSNLSSQTGMIITVRLPTEAEWEYACRAGTLTRFGGGDRFDESFINAINVPAETPDWAKTLLIKLRTNVLSDSAFDANPYGLAAMNGNVWEMVADSWHKDYSSAPNDGSAWDEIRDLSQNSSETYFVLRGGAFSRPAYMSQCFYRTNGRFISSGNNQTGFRVVIEIQE